MKSAPAAGTTTFRQFSMLVFFAMLALYYLRKQLHERSAFRDLLDLLKRSHSASYILIILWKSKIIAEQRIKAKEGEQYHQDTLFNIGAMGRIFISTGIVLCAEKGLLELEDNVRDFLPEIKNVEEEENPIRVLDLLLQVSGLPKRKNPSGPAKEVFKELEGSALRFVTGERHYNGADIDVLCCLLNHVAQQPFDRFLRDALFSPLLMQDTALTIKENCIYRTAIGAKSSVETRNCDGFYSTCTDLMRFFQFVINRGELDGHRLISESSMKVLTSILEESRNNDIKTSFGFFKVDLMHEKAVLLLSEHSHSKGELNLVRNMVYESVEKFCREKDLPPMYSPASLERIQSNGL